MLILIKIKKLIFLQKTRISYLTQITIQESNNNFSSLKGKQLEMQVELQFNESTCSSKLVIFKNEFFHFYQITPSLILFLLLCSVILPSQGIPFSFLAATDSSSSWTLIKSCHSWTSIFSPVFSLFSLSLLSLSPNSARTLWN